MRVVRNRVYKFERVFPLLAHHYPRGGLVGVVGVRVGWMQISIYLQRILYEEGINFSGKLGIGFLPSRLPHFQLP